MKIHILSCINIAEASIYKKNEESLRAFKSKKDSTIETRSVETSDKEVIK